MSMFAKAILFLVLLAVTGTILFLAIWDMPPPVAPVERVIPNERFSR